MPSRMFELYKQWLGTWRQTKDPRHLRTARICLDIAREDMTALSVEVELETIAAQLRANEQEAWQREVKRARAAVLGKDGE